MRRWQTTKKIKVKILPKVTNFGFKGQTYFPGDIVEIPERLFRGDFMEKVVKPKKKAVSTEKREVQPVEETPVTEILEEKREET